MSRRKNKRRKIQKQTIVDDFNFDTFLSDNFLLKRSDHWEEFNEKRDDLITAIKQRILPLEWINILLEDLKDMRN